jgi:hypothetical protein
MGNIIYSVQQDNLTTDMGITPIFPNNIEDASKDFVGGEIVAGQCLALGLNSASQTVLEVGSDASAVYGLAKESVNLTANVNEVKDQGGYGIFGSGKITACIFGVYEVKNFNFTTADGSAVAFNAIADITNASMVPGAVLGSNASGLITAVASDATSAFGTLIAVSDDTVQVKIGF